MTSSQKLELEKKKLSGRLCLKVGQCCLLNSCLLFREKKGGSICSNSFKQVLQERGELLVLRECVESDLPGVAPSHQAQCGKAVQWLIIQTLSLLVCVFIQFLSVSASYQSLAWLEMVTVTQRGNYAVTLFFFLTSLALKWGQFFLLRSKVMLAKI